MEPKERVGDLGDNLSEAAITVLSGTCAGRGRAASTHREACPGTQVLGSHQQGVEGGPSAAHARLRVLHRQ